jgi:acetyl esterase/lipase
MIPTSLSSSFGLDPSIAAALRSMGPVFDGPVLERSRALFAAGRDLSLPEHGARTDDIPYGDHPRQVLDVCAPGGARRPVVLFAPGGGFTGGDKAFYAHVPAFFARKGWLAAAMNYRLAPDFAWPAGAQDVASALDWLAEHAQRLGGDPSRIHVVAQSAGATHASGALFQHELRPRCHDVVRKAVLLSGFYRMSADTPVTTAALYFGSDETQYAQRSPLSHAPGSKVPVVLGFAQFDPAHLACSTLALAQALTTRDGRCPPLAWLQGHNHVSPVLGLGASNDLLGEAIHQALMESV